MPLKGQGHLRSPWGVAKQKYPEFTSVNTAYYGWYNNIWLTVSINMASIDSISIRAQ